MSPVPPYSAAGQYRGQWSAYIPMLGEDEVMCNIIFELKQEVLLNVYPLNHSVTGKITFDFDCGPVTALVLLLGLPKQVSYDVVLGTMASDGSVNLVGSDNEPAFSSGCIVNVATADTNEDGYVDTLEGTWYFTVSTGSLPVLVEGTFAAARPTAG